MSDYADNLRKSMINKTRRFMRMVQEMQEKDDAALREQVIRMAREAGLMDWNGQCVLTDGQLERFFHLAAAAGAAAERESALDLVDDYAKGNTDLRDAIRARGEK